MTAPGTAHRILRLALPILAIILVGAAYYFFVERNPQTHIKRGAALASEGNDDRAEAEFRKAIRLDSSSAEAHEHLGSLLRLRGSLSGAATEYQEAIRLKQDYAEARYNLARILFEQGDVQGAKAQFELLTTPSTPNGLSAFLQSELPFQEIPSQILTSVVKPDENPIVLSALARPGGSFAFRLNQESVSSEDLVPHLRDVFSTRQGVIWVYFTDRLPPFESFMQVTGILRDAGAQQVNLILVPGQS
jgi:tetratricopeptide (TPR) repeat protein